MDWLAPLIRYGLAPAWAHWEGSAYLRHLRRLKRSQYDAPPVIAWRQWTAVHGMVQHAYRHSEFYRRRLNEAGLPPWRMESLDDFRRVPLLTKDDLRQHGHSLLAAGHERVRLTRKRTSGSTGVAVEVWVDEQAHQFKRACTVRSDEWTGWRLGQPQAICWGEPSPGRRHWRAWLRHELLERSDYLNTLDIDEAALAAFADALARRPSGLLLGHAHSLDLFARFLQARGGANFRPRGIISTAMVLFPWQRERIEEVFGCRVTNRYGCEEVSLIAAECEQREGFHINAEGVFVEVLRADGTPAAPGETGRIVVTDLVNRAMPLVRYEIGDMGALAAWSCPCGRGLPVLERIEGRVADYVVTPSGKLVSGISLTDNFHTLVPGVVQMQIVQERLDLFRFRIVRDAEFSPASLKALEGLVWERFGPEVRFECEFVDRLVREGASKFRFCICKVEHPLLSCAGTAAS